MLFFSLTKQEQFFLFVLLEVFFFLLGYRQEFESLIADRRAVDDLPYAGLVAMSLARYLESNGDAHAPNVYVEARFFQSCETSSFVCDLKEFLQVLAIIRFVFFCL